MTTSMTWVDSDWLLFDLETTSPEPTECRIVTATLVELPANRRDPQVHNWVVDPGIPIPDGAAAIHGWTTERVQADGGPPEPAIAEISGMIRDAWDYDIPLLAFNASFDVTVTAAEMARHLGTALDLGPILDPFVCDKALDRYRKGSRKLGAVCEHYKVTLGEAHQSEADALAAGRVMWRLARVYPQLAAMSLPDLQTWQAAKYRGQAASLEAYKRKQAREAGEEAGNDPAAISAAVEAIVIPREWPLRQVAPAEQAVA